MPLRQHAKRNFWSEFVFTVIDGKTKLGRPSDANIAEIVQSFAAFVLFPDAHDVFGTGRYFCENRTSGAARLHATPVPSGRAISGLRAIGPTACGYYWVPGVWVAPPRVGLLWTPGYWGFVGGRYGGTPGYWGPHVGFYGGINYGFGYGGVGFVGGHWLGGHFAYNTAVVNVNRTVVRNVYVDRTVVRTQLVVNRASFNGEGGVAAEKRLVRSLSRTSNTSSLPPISFRTSTRPRKTELSLPPRITAAPKQLRWTR